jgi:hypothetical protein
MDLIRSHLSSQLQLQLQLQLQPQPHIIADRCYVLLLVPMSYFSRNRVIWAIKNKYYAELDMEVVAHVLSDPADEEYLAQYINENPYIFHDELFMDIYDILSQNIYDLLTRRNIHCLVHKYGKSRPVEIMNAYYHLYFRDSAIILPRSPSIPYIREHLQSLAQNELINDFIFYDVMCEIGAPDSDVVAVCERLYDSRPVLYTLLLNRATSDKAEVLRQILYIADLAHHSPYVSKSTHYRPEYKRCFKTAKKNCLGRFTSVCNNCPIKHFIDMNQPTGADHYSCRTNLYLMMREHYPHYLDHFPTDMSKQTRPTVDITAVTPNWFHDVSTYSDERCAMMARYGKSSSVIECLFNEYDLDIPIISAISADVYDSPNIDISIWRILEDYPILILNRCIYYMLNFDLERENIARILFRDSYLFVELYTRKLKKGNPEFVEWYRQWYRRRVGDNLLEIARTRFLFGADIAHKITEYYKIDHGIPIMAAK